MNRWGALVAVSLATLMMLIDFMAVAVALPAVHHTFNASFPELEWVLEAFVLTLAAFVLTAGHITDIVGRRPVFLGGLVVFAAGSLLGGLAQTPYVLIGARVVQGIGGALLFATGSVLLTETFRDARGRAAVAVWGTVTGLAVACSPLVGGEIASALGWRWLFLLEVPVSVLALVIGFVAIKEPVWDQGGTTYQDGAAVRAAPRSDREGDRVPVVDWLGLVLFTAAIAIVMIGLVRSATTIEGFSQSGVMACFLMTGLLLTAFIAWETVARAPMLDVSLFRQRTFAGSSIAAFGLSMAVLGPVLYLVLYMSFDRAYPELTIGTHLLLLTGVTLPFLPLTGFLDRYLPVKLLICGGLALVAAGLWLMSRLSAGGSLSELVPGLIVAGVGLELVNPRLAAAAAATVEPPLAAVASRTISTFRQIGTATGVAVFGAVFATQLSDHISERTAGIAQLANGNPTIANLVLDGHTAQAVRSAPRAVRPQILPIIQGAFGGAMHDVFFVAAFVALGSAALALSTRSGDLPRTGARQRTSESSLSEAGPSAQDAPSAKGPLPVPVGATGHAAVATTREGPAAQAGAEAPDAPAPDLEATELEAPDLEATELEAAARMAASTVGIRAMEAWHGWAGWQAPDQEPGEDVGPIVAADMPAGSLPDDEVVPAQDEVVPAQDEVAPPEDEVVPAQPLQAQPGDQAAAGAPEVTVSDFLWLWRGAGPSPAPVPQFEDLAGTVGHGTANGAAVTERRAKDNGAEDREAVDRGAGDRGPEDREADDRGAEDNEPQDNGPQDIWAQDNWAQDNWAQDNWAEDNWPEDNWGEDNWAKNGGHESAGSPTDLMMGRRWVRGQVTTATGEPLAGALVTLVTADGDEAGHAIAGSDGSFALGDIGEGTYTLIAAAPHFRPVASTVALRSDEATATLTLLAIGSITGKVTTAKDGLPMSVDIELFSPDGIVAAQCRNGKDGCFLLTDLPEGSYRLVVRSAGYRTAEEPVVVDRTETRTIDVAMVGLGHLYGAVTGPGGDWMPGVQVTLTDVTGNVVATTGTDGAGSYRFSEVPEGPYTVGTTAFGAAFSVVEVEAGSTVAADVNLASL